MDTRSRNTFLAAVMKAVGLGLTRLTDLIKNTPKAPRLPKTQYVGCPAGKFDTMTRQRLRAAAKKRLTAALREQFQMPRRVLRLVVRKRVRQEWRAA